MFNIKKNRWYVNLFFGGWISSLIIAIVFLILANTNLSGEKGAFNGFNIWFFFGFIPFFILHIIFAYKQSKTKDKTNAKVRFKEGKTGATNDGVYNHDGSETDISEDNKGMYGWNEEGEIAEYDLLNKFDEYIKENFPFVPLEEYIIPNHILSSLDNSIAVSGKPSIESLRELAISMQKHLGYKDNKVIVEIKPSIPGQRVAGTHERLIISFSSIVIYYSNAYSAINIIQIMAHEMSHAFQQYYGHPCYSDDELESEKFTDALAMYLGFGNIYKKGQKYKVGNTIYRLGYLLDNSLRHAYETYEIRLIKEKPIRETKRRFMELQSDAYKLLEGIKLHLEILEELIHNLDNRSDALEYKKKYLDTDYLAGVFTVVNNLFKYTEEEAKKRIEIVKNELLILIEINQKLSR